MKAANNRLKYQGRGIFTDPEDHQRRVCIPLSEIPQQIEPGQVVTVEAQRVGKHDAYRVVGVAAQATIFEYQGASNGMG